ncbi:uncharacterized protein LOC126908053 [Daktulosphaira vitifoliae]|uniref:uncharacterized protein LOC126908053 n=1 Tax=Daktulosphaira vitifoliae TaxID=58002 RepID=UPI0021AB02A5|nr:uncharacterized protein LOC126908053 [Daktulosphaira vitifoliae]
MNELKNDEIVSNTKNSNQSTENNRSIFYDLYRVGPPYPNSELEKRRKILKIVRAKSDDRRNIIYPYCRHSKDKPLHEVFKEIMNRDIFAMRANETEIIEEYPKWQVNDHKLENIIDPSKINTTQKTLVEQQKDKSIKDGNNSSNYDKEMLNNKLKNNSKEPKNIQNNTIRRPYIRLTYKNEKIPTKDLKPKKLKK